MSKAAGDTVALVTGANKGIGFEIARGLGAKGFVVLLGCRESARAQKAAEALTAEGARVQTLSIDVTDHDSVQRAAADIERQFGRLDILINNAGVNLEAGAKPSQVDLAVMRRVYDVNVFGTARVTQAMLPLLMKAESGRIVNVTSRLGSISLAADPNGAWPMLMAYNSSKAALNALTVQFAKELRGTRIKVNAGCPGNCSTDMNPWAGNRTAAQGAVTPIRLATLPEDGPTGCFFNDAGAVPW